MTLFIKLSTDPDRKIYYLYEGNGSFAGDYKLDELSYTIRQYYITPFKHNFKGEDKKILWNKPRIEHPLRDVEFHTDLGNVVDNFMSQIPGVGKKDWRAFFHAFVGSKSDKRWNINWYFKSWKKNKPKWRNAIREFTKAVKQRGFDAPAA